MICCLPPLYKNLKNLLLIKELQQQPWFFKQASKISTQPVGGFSSLWSYPPGLCITWRSVLYVPQKKAHQPQQNEQIDWCWSLKMKQPSDDKHVFFPGTLAQMHQHSQMDPRIFCCSNRNLPPPRKLSWVCGQVISNFPWSLRWARNRMTLRDPCCFTGAWKKGMPRKKTLRSMVILTPFNFPEAWKAPQFFGRSREEFLTLERWRLSCFHDPICSMYGIFTYIYLHLA